MNTILAFLYMLGSFSLPHPCKEDAAHRVDSIKIEFCKKLNNPSYELNSTAKRCYNYAKKITVFDNEDEIDEIILNHPEDYDFLTSAPHFIHKHIIVSLNEHNHDLRIRFDKERQDLIFHTNESVSEKRQAVMMNPDIVYNLDFFKLEELNDNEKILKIRPNFQREGDGKYYFELIAGTLTYLPTPQGNHVWLRLIDGKGQVYSIGMHPIGDNLFSNAYSKRPARFYNSDLHEWLEERDRYAYKFPISKEEFFDLKNEITDDLYKYANIETAPDYCVFKENCSDWLLEKLAKYIILDKDAMTIDVLAVVIPKTYEYLSNNTPKSVKTAFQPIKKGICYTAHFPRFIMFLTCHGYEKNPENPNSEPFFQPSTEFIFDTKMHLMLHPFYFFKYLEENYGTILDQRIAMLNEQTYWTFSNDSQNTTP